MKPMRLALLPAVLLAAGTAAADQGAPVTVKTLITTDKTVLGQKLVLPKRDPVLIASRPMRSHPAPGCRAMSIPFPATPMCCRAI